MAEITLDLSLLSPTVTQTPPYDFRTDETLLARAEYTAMNLLAGRRMTHGDEIMLSRAVIRLTDEGRAKERVDKGVLLVVEGIVERDALQRLLDPTTRDVHVITAMQQGHAVRGRRYNAIFIRYPSFAWFEAKGVETHEFQEWEREVLYPRLIKGGFFQHI